MTAHAIRIELPLTNYIGFKLEELLEAYIIIDHEENMLSFVERHYSFEWDEDTESESEGKDYYRDRSFYYSLSRIGGLSLCFRQASEAWIITIENTLSNDLRFVIATEKAARAIHSQLFNALKPVFKKG